MVTHEGTRTDTWTGSTAFAAAPASSERGDGHLAVAAP